MPSIRHDAPRATVSVFLLAIVVALAAGPVHADAVADAVAHPGRSAADLKRDAIDHPAEVLPLAGIKPGMVVVDYLAGDGYYSELASYLVGPHGKVWLLNNMAFDHWSEYAWQDRIGKGRLPNVEHETIEVEHLGLPPRSVDVVIVSKVYHDLYWQPGEEGWPVVDAKAALDEIARVLKPGGMLLLVDHSARAGTGKADAGTLHRIDEQFARADFERHGFEFVAASDALRRPDDPRTQVSYKAPMLGKTDRFVLVFRRR